MIVKSLKMSKFVKLDNQLFGILLLKSMDLATKNKLLKNGFRIKMF